MNRNLLTVALGLALGTSATLALAPVKESITAGNHKPAQMAPASRATTADGFELRFCNDIYTAYRLSNTYSTNYTCYVYITPDVATQLAGNKLDKITFSTCIQSNKNGLDGSVFVSEDIQGEPVTSTSAKFINCFINDTFSTQTVELETPYEIKAGQGFYYGYKVERVKQSDYVVSVDAGPATPFGGTAVVQSLSGATEAVVNADDLGANIFICANTVGDKKDLLNIANLPYMMLGPTTLPMLNTEKGVSAQLAINNLGSNAINSLEYTYSFDGSEAKTGTVSTSIPALGSYTVAVDIPSVPEGFSTLSLNITKINDADADLSAGANLIGYTGQGYDRKMVVEEGTSMYCGYCPRGIVGMEYMTQTYPESFIGIAVHSTQMGSEALCIDAYQNFCNYYFSGLPSCIVNRDPYFILDPNKEYLQEVYNLVTPYPSAAQVSIEEAVLSDDGSSVQVRTSSTFAFNEDNADYRLAFVVLEDGLKGAQTNYFSGAGEAMGGWEKKGRTVAWTYEDTARDIFDLEGLKESLPATIEADKAYEYSYNVSLDNIYIGSGDKRQGNVEDTKIVVLLLEAKTGNIINAARITADKYKHVTGGVNSVLTDGASDTPAEYYNLQGVRMASDNLPAGIYIVKQGNTAKKVRF